MIPDLWKAGDSTRRARVTVGLCLLFVGATSAGSIVLMAMSQFREVKDVFFSRLGTDLALATSRAGLIASAYTDPELRAQAFDAMASEYLADERISCIELTYQRIKVESPPPSVCSALRVDDVIEQRFGANGEGEIRFHLSFDRFNADNRRHFLLTMAAFAMTSFSFAIAALVLIKLGESIKARKAIDAVERIFEIMPVLVLEIDAHFEVLRTSKRLSEYLLDINSEPNGSLESIFDADSSALLKSLIVRYGLNDVVGAPQDGWLSLKSSQLSGTLFSAVVEANPLAERNTYFVFLSDVSALANEKTRLSQLLRTDFLTGALSRRYLEEKYADGSRDDDLGLIMVDLDFFKSINDNYGHETGDLFLKYIVVTLRELAPAGSSVVRLSGEEFLVVTQDANPKCLLVCANRIKDQLASQGLQVESGELVRTVSIGVAVVKTEDKLSEALRVADYALLLSKRNGRNRATYVSVSEYAQFLKDKPTVEEVESAVRSNLIDLHYEPVYDFSSGQIIGFESLLRWHSGSGWVSPVNFIDAYYHVTNRLSGGRSRFELFAKTASSFPSCGENCVWLSYNLWPGDIDEGLLEWLDSLDSGLKSLMVLEVSEKLLISRQSEARVASVLRAASRAGCRIALDDFGVEGSNLVRLQEYPVNIVKIDKALVTGLTESSVNLLIIESLSSLAEKLGISVIAEGVETQADAQLLAKAGVHQHQGYWYGKAMPADAARRLVDAGLRFGSDAGDGELPPPPED